MHVHARSRCKSIICFFFGIVCFLLLPFLLLLRSCRKGCVTEVILGRQKIRPILLLTQMFFAFPKLYVEIIPWISTTRLKHVRETLMLRDAAMRARYIHWPVLHESTPSTGTQVMLMLHSCPTPTQDRNQNSRLCQMLVPFLVFVAIKRICIL